MRLRFLSISIAFAAVTIAGCDRPYSSIPPPGRDAEVYVADRAPPAISGGTLLVTKDLRTAVAADSDRDRVWVVDLESRSLRKEVVLEQGDEPGRVLEDDAGRVHVLLRRGGAIATIDPASGELLARRSVCVSPRGIALDATTSTLYVACESGELVSMPSFGDGPTHTVKLQRDLRDVVLDGGQLLVTRFRSADILVVSLAGEVLATKSLPALDDPNVTSFGPAVAWRMVPLSTGGAVIAHQRGADGAVPTQPGGYGSVGVDECAGIVQTVASFFGAVDATTGTRPDPQIAPAIPDAALPVDVALDPARDRMIIAAAGSQKVLLGVMPNSAYNLPSSCNTAMSSFQTPGEPIGVAFAGNAVVAQIREPAGIAVFEPDVTSETVTLTVALPGESVRDSGHDLFHHAPRQGLGFACASCHPEGREDGRTWNFDGNIGARRTQNIGGGILETAPFHWDGALPTMNALVNEVFTTRMSGDPVGPHRARAFKGWVSAIPLLPIVPPLDTGAVERGQAIFQDATVGCTGCHAGPELTNNRSFDVGTGGVFQVPSLRGVADRAPYLHNGCAASLKDRFTAASCGGGDAHGRTSQLSDAQLDDLVAYLETL